MTIGTRIRAMRTTLGITQGRLARTIGVTPSALSQIEHGTVRALKAETLVRLAVALRVNAQWLQTGRGSPVVETIESVDESEAVAIFRALTVAARAAWMAAGRALLDAQPDPSPTKPYPLPKSVRKA